MDKQKKLPEIYREQIRQLYEQSIVASIGAGACAIILAAMLFGTIDSVILFVWTGSAITITVSRHIVVFRFHQKEFQDISAKVWERRFIFLILISGIVWGASGIFLFPADKFELQMILFFILIGMSAGASDTFSAVPAAFFAYTVPALTPIIIQSILLGDHAHAVLGYGTLIFFLAISMYAMRFYAKTMELLKLKFANMDLIKKLATEKEKIENTNKNLKAEIVERRQMEDVLADHKKNLEKIVAERTMDLQEANIGLKTEIEEKNRAASALIKSEKKYRLVVESANDAICILQDGKMKFHNRKMETLLGYEAGEIATIPYMDFIHTDDITAGKHLYLETRTGQSTPSAITLSLIRKDGERIWVQTNGVSHAWEGRPGMLCMFRDVTRQRHLEKQLVQSQKMEAIGGLASGIAHDINNILGGIQGNVSMLLREKDPKEPDHKKLTDIESYIKSGSGLTRRLLGFARPGTEEIKPADIAEVVGETIDIFARAHKDIRVITEYEPEPTIIDIDITQIQQVFLNLMVNAMHAMPGGGTVYIQTKKLYMDKLDADAFGLEAGDYIRVSSTDTGCGIDELTLPKIFEPFFTTKSKDKGTGLGLYTAYRTIKKHGGHITVYSKPENGTTFNIYLPVSKQHPEAGENESNLKRAEMPTGSETILLVEDEPDILDVGKELLEVLGYTVMTASSGSDAISEYKAASAKISLVILDLMLPDMKGEEIFSEIKAIRPDVRVLLASGFAKNGKAAKLLSEGCEGFIQKPYNIQQLSSAIREILDRAS